MQEFDFQHPGRILSGEGKKAAFVEAAKAFSERALLICGPHFARSGELAELEASLEAAGVRCWLVPDLRVSSIEHARVLWELCRKNEVGLVIGAGGATVMDFAKAVAYGACQKEDIWPVIAARGDASGPRLALATIPTFPSSGSDLDGAAEVEERETGRMGGIYGDALRADLCWLNPAYVAGIPSEILAYGAMTAVVQASVAYLNEPRSDFAEQMALSVIRTIFKNLQPAMEGDLGAISELQLAACMNGVGLTGLGKGEIDFSLYLMEGMAERYWEIPYAVAVPVVFPHWLRAVASDTPLFRDYFRAAWQVQTEGKEWSAVLEAGLAVIRETYEALGIASTLQALRPATSDVRRRLACVREQMPCESKFRVFTEADVDAVLKAAEGEPPAA